MENDKKWYIVKYETGNLQDKFFVSSPEVAEQFALIELELYSNVIEVEVEEKED